MAKIAIKTAMVKSSFHRNLGLIGKQTFIDFRSFLTTSNQYNPLFSMVITLSLRASFPGMPRNNKDKQIQNKTPLEVYRF